MVWQFRIKAWLNAFVTPLLNSVSYSASRFHALGHDPVWGISRRLTRKYLDTNGKKMPSTKTPSHLRRLLCCLLVLAVSGFTHGSAFLNSLAWTRYVHAWTGKILPDGNGNLYVAYSVFNFGAPTDIWLAKYDSSGNVLFNKRLFSRPGFYIQFNGIWLSSPSALKPAVYISCSGYGGTTHETVVSKSDMTGNLLWERVFTSSTINYIPVGGSVDSADNYWLAMSEGAASSALEMIKFGPTGNTLLDKTNSTITPDRATFVNGKWCVTGEDLTSVEPPYSTRWGLFDPATGNFLSGARFDFLDNGTSRYYYAPMASYVDPAGAIDIAVNVTQNDYSGRLIAEKTFYRRYNLTGSLQWFTPSINGGAFKNISSYGTNNSFIGSVSGYMSPYYLEGRDHLGNLLWTRQDETTWSSFPPIVDASGFYTFGIDLANRKKFDITRFDNSCNVQWKGGPVTAAGDNTDYGGIVDTGSSGNNLYVAVNLPENTKGNITYIQRYVTGLALSAMTATNINIVQGSTNTIKVQLNEPAPTGGVPIKLQTSSRYALFSNNTTAITFVIPAGAIYATVPVQTKTVPWTTGVTILGDENGVQRSASFNITPP
jgi:hypothetical protein